MRAATPRSRDSHTDRMSQNPSLFVSVSFGRGGKRWQKAKLSCRGLRIPFCSTMVNEKYQFSLHKFFPAFPPVSTPAIVFCYRVHLMPDSITQSCSIRIPPRFSPITPCLTTWLACPIVHAEIVPGREGSTISLEHYRHDRCAFCRDRLLLLLPLLEGCRMSIASLWF